ncbi:heavy metal translocatin [Lojkania enalia]|uniref:Heavy metal translocatin n=1 Tax=Lojkania enalia TaxID=147567 RepID=A0A9P4K6T4_9PLEO|nr:heavy metal translocatin [Didymosphaeria enalia]
MTSQPRIITTLTLSNFHCPSCQPPIQRALSRLRPPPHNITTSLRDRSVTTEHDAALSASEIRASLIRSGFLLDEGEPHASGASHPNLFRQWNVRRRARLHLNQCNVCQEVKRAGKRDDAEERFEKSKEKAGTQVREKQEEKGEPKKGAARRVYFSIGGMTCASCVGAVTEKIEEVAGVIEVAVDLIGKSAMVVVPDEKLNEEIVKKVEDAGFEAEVVSTELVDMKSGMLWVADFDIRGMAGPKGAEKVTEAVKSVTGVADINVDIRSMSANVKLESKHNANAVINAIDATGMTAIMTSMREVRLDTTKSTPRTMRLRVDGMVDGDPLRIVEALQDLNKTIVFEKELSLNDPIIQLTYVPDVPKFTIREIINSIRSMNSRLQASIVHPPTIEEKARGMQLQEEFRLRIRIIFIFVTAIPTFLIGVVFTSLVKKNSSIRRHFEAQMWVGRTTRAQWALFILSTPVMFFGADIFHRRSLHELWSLWKKGSTTPVWRRLTRFGSMNLLVGLGVTIAYVASLALLVIDATMPPLDGHSPAMEEGGMSNYFDTVVFLTLFIMAGRYIEAYSKRRTSDSINLLKKLRPVQALLIVDKQGSENVESISVEMLEIGDTVRVLPGASPPSDGIIVSDEDATFSEASLTGESRPVTKTKGDEVFAGTINLAKPITVEVTVRTGETMLDQIVQVVRQGSSKKAPLERIADRITSYFVPVITLVAIITWITWLSLGLSGHLPESYRNNSIGGWPLWSLEFAIAVFVIACPCGIALAAPTALFVGSGVAAKHGILARGGGEAFQEASQVDIIVFDKTGTLTEGGQPTVRDFDTNPEFPTDIVFGAALALESNSSHPLATAIRKFCADQGAVQASVSAVEEVAGRGLGGIVSVGGEGARYNAVIGNERWLHTHDVTLPDTKVQLLNSWKAKGHSVVLMALSKADKPYTLVAMFSTVDPLRKEAPSVVRKIQERGITAWMISGDNEMTAMAVADQVGIARERVVAGAMPKEKADKIKWIQQEGGEKMASGWRRKGRSIVAMIGDGINDAPALTVADIGVAIGSGSDIAVSSAKFVLLTENLQCLLTLADLSRTIINRVKFNFFWAIVYNTVALPIAAGAIYPSHHYRLSPVWASLAMALSSISVVCSSLLLRLYKAPRISFPDGEENAQQHTEP